VILRASIGLILAALLAAPAQAADLRLTVTGVRSDGGELLIGLYDNPEGYAHAIANASKGGLMPDRGRLVGLSIRARQGSETTVFAQLPPGRYAAIVIHDENDNGHLDANAIGIPTEGYCFGNNARGFLGAPSFEAASVTVGTADVSTAVALVYPTMPSAEETSDYRGYGSGVLGAGR
jgi:uncharacterized protein (DUF2141 family)